MIHKIRDIIRSKFDAPYVSWKHVPIPVRDMWFKEFESSFTWEPHNQPIIRRNFEQKGSARLHDMFTDIRKSGERPGWIGESVWADLENIWHFRKYAKKREQVKNNRSSDADGASSSKHIGGSVPHTEIRRRLEKSLGRLLTILELHAYTHQRHESQEWIDIRSKYVFDAYHLISEPNAEGDETSQAANDYSLWLKAAGGKKKGRTYGLGSEAKTYETPLSYSQTRQQPGRESIEEKFERQQKELEELRVSLSETQRETQELRHDLDRYQRAGKQPAEDIKEVDKEEDDDDDED